MFRRYLALLACALLALPGGLRADMAAGVAAYQVGDFDRAFAQFAPLAEQGLPRAQTIVGLMYGFGEGAPQSYFEAARWYRLAADQGYASAQYNLAELYAAGAGVPRNLGAAINWMERAARQGHGQASARLHVLLAGTEPSHAPGISGDRVGFVASSFGTRLVAAPDTATRVSMEQREALGDSSDPAEPDRLVRLKAEAALLPFGVQVSSFRSREVAQDLLARLLEGRRDLFGELKGRVERTDLGAGLGVWYRVRFGRLPNRQAAVDLCEAALVSGTLSSCIPVHFLAPRGG